MQNPPLRTMESLEGIEAEAIETGGGRSLLSDWLIPGSLILGGLVSWQLITTLFRTPAWLLPSPSDILLAMISSSDLLLRHAWVTLQEVVIGFVVAFALGVSLAVAIVYSRTLERAIYPLVIASQTVPVIAIAPLLLIWFGYDLLPKVIVVALICFFPIVVNTVDGLRSVDPELVNLLRTLRATRWQLFAKAQFPASLPFLFSGTRVAVAVSVIGAVIGEWVGASAGLGYYMVRSASQMQTSKVFAAIVILSVMGIALFGLVAVLERRLLPWYHNGKRDGTRGL